MVEAHTHNNIDTPPVDFYDLIKPRLSALTAEVPQNASSTAQINNLRVRVREIEDRLRTLGLIQ